jgi:hypothetical protein
MFEVFDDTASSAFVECVRTNAILHRRISYPIKLNRLKELANIVLGRVSAHFSDKTLLESLVDSDRAEEFFSSLKGRKR